VINCTFIGNRATFKGGGMSSSGVSATVINCTFSQNTADFGGGGIFSWQINPTVINCILWNDSPDEILNRSGTAFVSFSDVQGGYPGEGNIDADPLFVDPQNGDLHLSPGSPCIDAGDNTAVPKGIDTDLDGNPRFVDDPATKDTGNGDPPIVDMGAYEFQVVTCPWDLDGNGSVGASDLLLLLLSWGPCKGCPADFDGNGNVGASDLLALLVNWGPCP
jgi:predicted outer membrane repeat protein